MAQRTEIPDTPDAPKLSGRPEFPDNPDFLNDKLILDSNAFIDFAEAPHEVLSRVGGRPIHHTEEIQLELAAYYEDPVYPLDDTEETFEAMLDDFGSTLLPATDEMEKIAGTIRDYLLRAGIQSEQVEAAENDIRIVSCGIAHQADIASSDRLFYVIGEIFKTNIRIIYLRKPPKEWVANTSKALKNQGISTPIDLLKIALNQDSA